VDSRGAVRDQLAARQREVLDDLLAGRTPPGFDAAPELDLLPDWRAHFHTWAAQHPQQGCAHDDVRDFLTTIGAPTATEPATESADAEANTSRLR
jgi:hypothetical protein